MKRSAARGRCLPMSCGTKARLYINCFQNAMAKAKCADEFGHAPAGAAWRLQAEGIITGDWKRSMRSWRKVERSGHETEEKDEKGKKRSPAAMGVER